MAERLRLKTLAPWRVRLFNAIALRARTFSLALGNESVEVSVVAREVLEGAHFARVLTLQLGKDLWRLWLTDENVLRAHELFAAPELADCPVESLPEALREAFAGELLAGPFAELAQKLELSCALTGYAAAEGSPDAQHPGLGLHLTLAHVSLRALLETDEPEAAIRLAEKLRALPRAKDGLAASILAALPLSAAVVAAEMPVTLNELKNLAAGDVCLPDWRPSEGAGKVIVRSAGRTLYEAEAKLDGASATLTEALRLVTENDNMTQTDDIPVTLTFELDARTITVGELQSLQPGYVFQLAADADAPVTLRVNGLAVAKGRLVEVNGAVGVELVSANAQGAQ